MDSFAEYVRQFADLINAGAAIPLPSATERAPLPEANPDAPAVLIFSPHPDDEVIMGALALRLARQCQWRIVNVAVTLGSKVSRRGERRTELANCCRKIGFELLEIGPDGLESVNPAAAQANDRIWTEAVETIRRLLISYRPRLVLFPHEDDWNSTHIGVNRLLRQALAEAALSPGPWICETEFWGQMPSPNLLVESSTEDVADLVSALACHVGEVRRNPYHLTLPAWMMENVRRAELVVGQGGAVPPIRFGTLYRLGRWRNGCIDKSSTGRALLRPEDPAALFPE